jgi:hypothetical protein
MVPGDPLKEFVFLILTILDSVSLEALVTKKKKINKSYYQGM